MSPESALQNYATTRDPDSFRVLVQRYETFVYAVCCRMLTSADAEDAVQDVFFKLMRHADQIQDDAAGWLHRCAVNTCRDILRRNQTRQRRESNQDLASNDSSATPTSQVLAEIDEALFELQDHDRLLLTRYYLDGETQQAIAADLMVNQSTVQRRMDAALERLRMTLTKRGVVAAVAGISAAMTTSATQATVPPTVSTGLAKLALAAPPLETASTKPTLLGSSAPWTFKIAASVFTVLFISAGATWMSLYLSNQDSLEQAKITITDQPAQAFYRQQFDMSGGPALSSLIQEVQNASQQAGYSASGPATFLHPEGIGTSPETTMIIAIPVKARTATSEAILLLPQQTTISVKSRSDENPYEVITRLEAAATESGYERNFQDRFVNFDPSDETGFAYEVQLGIRRSD